MGGRKSMTTINAAVELKTLTTQIIDEYAGELEQARSLLNDCEENTLLTYAARMYKKGGMSLPPYRDKGELIAHLIHGAQIVLMRRAENTLTFVTNLAESEARLRRVARACLDGWLSEFRSWNQMNTARNLLVS
jgi:hypothetical protein